MLPFSCPLSPQVLVGRPALCQAPACLEAVAPVANRLCCPHLGVTAAKVSARPGCAEWRGPGTALFRWSLPGCSPALWLCPEWPRYKHVGDTALLVVDPHPP